MPPKKNIKKGKKGGDDDDEFWAQKEAALASPAPEAQEAEEEEDGGGLGGLMSRMRKSKKKRNTFADLDQDDDESKPAGIEEVRANPDDEWPEEDVKPKKGKKSKKAKAKAQADSDDEEEAEEVPEVKAAPAKVEKPVEKEVEEKDDEDDEGPKLLTKKEKEKLKKEKEKEKKKAQAAAKRAAAGDTASPTPSAPAPPPVDSAPAPPAGDDAEEEDVDADDATAADKKKKKKKKAAAKVEAPPAPAKGKKVPAHIAAMQAAVAEKKRIEEEAAAAEAERQRILAEEDARIEEEEAKIEAQKAAKKAKEKERMERLKKEGKLLSPAEKQRRAVAEARKQALLDAGVKVAGLQEGGATIKKPFNKKKAPPKPKAAASAAESSTPAPAPEPEATPEPAAAPKAEESEDDWDKSDEDSTEKLANDVKDMKVHESEDDWDKSEDEAPIKTPTTPSVEAKSSASKPTAPAKQAATAAAAPAPAAAAATASTSKPAANGKASAATAAQPEDDDEPSDDDSDDSDSESETESDSSVDSEDERIEAGRAKYMARRDAAMKASEGKSELRSPICCILGHVDHGKTRLLDKIRQTSVAEGEAGGITQQIGATFFPSEAIINKSNIVNVDNYEVKIPGLLIIDTPGHEAFANLRGRGSSLCNIAILVVDITQAFQKQTLESLKLLKEGKTPFVVAVNKVDRLFDWKPTPDNGFRASYEKQSQSTKKDFENRLSQIKLALAENGFNSEIFDENKKLGSVVSLVPTSAFTGEGIPDMLLLLAKLTQERMNKSLMYVSSLSCTILEVKRDEENGTTLDVILSNGHLKCGDTIVLCGTDGPIVAKVRALLTPAPMRELRLKSAYVKHETVKAALGVKIMAPGLEKAIAGARVYVAENEEEVSYFKDLCMDDLQTLKRFAVGQKGKGVYVQASTLGALEALLTFLQTSKIPVHDFGVGPVFAKTIRAHASMAEKAPEYACVLAFDVTIEKDAKDFAAKEGLKIFAEPVIYHLFDSFNKYLAEVIEARERDAMDSAVWPVRLSIISSFANRDPIILGCDIKEGTLRVGTPVGVVKYDKATKVREIIKLGKITSLEKEHKSVDIVKKTAVGGGIAVKIERAPWETAKMFGRHFELTDEVVSLISRKSIDTLKNVFRKQVTNDEWNMIRKMKDEQGVQ